LFVNARRLDFPLRDGSPASRIGFIPFDYTKAGRVGMGLSRTTRVALPRAYPGKPVPPTPTPIALDFEDHAVGEKARGATTIEETAEAVIRVTNETAASGKHSLKFVDKPGQKHNFNPHLYFQPGFQEGVATASFALRVENNAHFYHQWRTETTGSLNGPTIVVRPDGALYAGERRLLDVPLGVWFRVELRCGLGKKADGRYTVIIRLPGRTAPLRFDNLPCHPDFDRINWFGFVADGVGEGVFYVDDIRLSVRP